MEVAVAKPKHSSDTVSSFLSSQLFHLLLKQKSATKTYLINKMPPTKHGVEI
jgi:hypothetical protein